MATMSFTPAESLIGGLLIGTSASLSILLDGKILGISGIIGPLLRSVALREELKPATLWKVKFILGLVVGGLVMLGLDSESQPFSYTAVPKFDWWRWVVSGVCVGFGTRLGTGCTSGHGVCGLARLSGRSLVAVPTFMGLGVLTASLACEYGACSGSWRLAPIEWLAAPLAPAVAVGISAVLLLFLALCPAHLQGHFGAPVSGIIFGLGLGVSGMTSQLKVLGFLNLAHEWDPSLALVMGGAMLVTFPAFKLTRREGAQPWTEGLNYEKPKTWPVEPQFILGNILFGLGWGLCGVCPGPALVAVVPYLLRSHGSAAAWFFAMQLLVILASWLSCDRFLARVQPNGPGGKAIPASSPAAPLQKV